MNERNGSNIPETHDKRSLIKWLAKGDQRGRSTVPRFNPFVATIPSRGAAHRADADADDGNGNEGCESSSAATPESADNSRLGGTSSGAHTHTHTHTAQSSVRGMRVRTTHR